MRIVMLAVIVVGGFIGFVWFQNARFAQENRDALERGELATAAENFRTLASYYRWFEYVNWPYTVSPCDIRLSNLRVAAL